MCVCLEHAAIAPRGQGDGQRAEEHAGGAGQQGDGGGPVREHGPGADNRSVTHKHTHTHSKITPFFTNR